MNKKSVLYGDLTKLRAKRVRYDFVTQSGEDNFNLLTMTPYFYKTNPTRIDKLDFNNDELTLDFSIFVYKK